MTLDEIKEAIGVEPYYEEPSGLLYCADCMDILPKMPEKCVDLVLTDPPYGITQNEWDHIPQLTAFWLHTCKITDVLISTSSQPFTTDLINSNREWFKYEWIWCKTRRSDFLNVSHRPLKQHENVCVFARDKTIYNPQGLIRQRSNNSRPAKRKVKTTNYGRQREHDRSEYVNYPTSLLRIANPKNKIEELIHPTQKPIALMAYLTKTHSNKNNLILDPFLGSGTTAVAAKQLGRKFIGIEIEKKYCDIAVQRLAQEVLI